MALAVWWAVSKTFSLKDLVYILHFDSMSHYLPKLHATQLNFYYALRHEAAC